VRARPDARTVALALNGAGALGLALVLLVAHLLQRVGLVATGFGLILNIRCGPRPLHYGLVLIGALFGVAAADFPILMGLGAAGFGWQAQDLHEAGAVGDAGRALARTGAAILDHVARRLVALVEEMTRYPLANLKDGPLAR
jgi:hypothetical protein